ncbi:MAG: S24 family peptidase [Bacteroidia bacterium]|nr:S24 family peptidase [Bacteroidia bacterium]
MTHFTLPILGKGNFRAFEISGDSMLPLASGTIVVGEKLDRLADLKDGNTYVLVTRQDGIVYKRVFNYLRESGELMLVSDNDKYKPYAIDPNGSMDGQGIHQRGVSASQCHSEDKVEEVVCRKMTVEVQVQ